MGQSYQQYLSCIEVCNGMARQFHLLSISADLITDNVAKIMKAVSTCTVNVIP